ncbi:Rpn family recombination-promoting nuclease/putative transposase [Anaerovorax odorimutans]|uniref:Rpn family recombination-promoting nuclease/putative transposase n=1 Tax=Anaerovorax odorimutans TaxID=109327 RepID=A0ABT1RKV6_9FIRM|nr:Rpn family recombination-promoting nuclease/putative transposase [Anaerovorax odorimutans]MCQ4635821.1 Rpn family recombination-promoting nuclease/putative transposase [Anaerovorax odorimutans]
MQLEKELKDLNLLDRFLFAEAMEDPEIVEMVLEILLGKEVVLKHLPQVEKEKRSTLWNRQVKLDIWAMDEDETVYNAEVQKKNTFNLPRRSRFYHSLIDSRLLKKGTIDFNELNDVYVIMIMPFDLFGKGLYQYTFRMECEEIPGLRLEDGAVRIFFNTHGRKPENMNPELPALLRYFEHTTTETAEASSSKTIRKIHEKIQAIKADEEIGVKYMNAWEEKLMERQEGYEAGMKEGRFAGHREGSREKQKEIALKMKSRGISLEEIAELTGLAPDEIEAL